MALSLPCAWEVCLPLLPGTETWWLGAYPAPLPRVSPVLASEVGPYGFKGPRTHCLVGRKCLSGDPGQVRATALLVGRTEGRSQRLPRTPRRSGGPADGEVADERSLLGGCMSSASDRVRWRDGPVARVALLTVALPWRVGGVFGCVYRCLPELAWLSQAPLSKPLPRGPPACEPWGEARSPPDSRQPAHLFLGRTTWLLFTACTRSGSSKGVFFPWLPLFW